MSKRTEHDPSLVLDPEQARRLARALQSNPKLTPEAEAELQRRAEESRATLPPKPAAWSPGGANLFSGVVAGLFALLVMMTGEARAQLCGATCLDVETVGAATVQDQETGTATMYDSCTYTDCTCTDTDASADPVWICCNVSTQHGWGSFGEGCVSYSAGEVIVYGMGTTPAPIPEPGDLSWSLLDWLGDLLRETPEHDDHGGVVLVDLWPEWHTRQASKLVDGGGNIEWISPREAERPTLEEFAAYLQATGWYDTEDNTDNESTPTLEDPSEREGFTEYNPLGTEYRSGPTIEVPPLVLYEPAQPPTPEPTPEGTPTAAPVEPTPAACPPGTTPMLGGLFCLDYWAPGGDWRWGLLAEPDLREVEHGQPCGQEGEPPCPGANHPQPQPCPPNREPCNIGCCWETGRPPPDGEVVVD